MKKYFQRVVLVAVAMATAQGVVAESWRIHNDPNKGAHFTSINEAMASADVVDGDVLYLDPGADITGDQTITKAVTLIGTGWGFNDMPYVPSKISGHLYIKAKATVTGVYVTKFIYPQYNEIVIERCLTTGIWQTSSSIESKYVKIISCYLKYHYGGRGNSIAGAGNDASATQGWEIYNTYAESQHSAVTSLFQPLVVNCSFYAGQYGEPISDISSGIVKNCLLASYSSGSWADGCTDCSIAYNCVYGSMSSYPNNKAVFTGRASWSDVVVSDGSYGGAWQQLCEDSPAIGAGEGGVDCGIYAEGSLYPFVTSGFPKYVPYFTETSVPAQPTDGQVKVSLKIVNQND